MHGGGVGCGRAVGAAPEPRLSAFDGQRSRMTCVASTRNRWSDGNPDFFRDHISISPKAKTFCDRKRAEITMGKWHEQFERDGELSVSALKREFGADVFPRRGPVRSIAFKCKTCGLRFPVRGTGSVASGQANSVWRKRHPICARGAHPVCDACAWCGACAAHPTSPTARPPMPVVRTHHAQNDWNDSGMILE